MIALALILALLLYNRFNHLTLLGKKINLTLSPLISACPQNVPFGRTRCC